MQALLESGSAVDAHNNEGWTALFELHTVGTSPSSNSCWQPVPTRMWRILRE